MLRALPDDDPPLQSLLLPDIMTTPHRPILVFYSAVDDFGAWQAALAAAAPEVDVRLAEEIDDPARVRYALVWKPPAHFFSRYPSLQLVINLGAGVDSLLGRTDLPAVPITRLSDPAMARMMAGYVLFAVLRHARDIVFFQRAQRAARWSYRHPKSADQTRVGILGLGELGSVAALELARQGFDVRGWARTPGTVDGVACFHGLDTLGTFLAASQVLVVMLPLTPHTTGLLDRSRLQQLPQGACLVNVARGKVIDEAALIEMLKSGHIAEATLDVFAQEPLPADNPLWAMDQVLITPHLASVALPATASTQIAENIRRVEAGESVLHQVDPARGY